MKNKELKKDTRTVPTYWQIIDSARELFAEHGFRDTTIRMISQKADVNGASVNYYFRSKDALYEAIFTEAFQKMGKPMTDLIASVHDQKTWEAAVNSWFEFMLTLFLSDKPEDALIRRLVARERTSPSESCETLFEDIFAPILQILMTLIKMAKPEADELELKAIFVTFLAQCTCFMNRDPPWNKLLIPEEYSREEWIKAVQKQIANVFFCGLSFKTANI